MKKIVSLIMSLSLVFTVGITAFAANDEYSGDVKAKIEADLTAEFTSPTDLTYTASYNGTNIVWTPNVAADFSVKNLSVVDITATEAYTPNPTPNMGVPGSFTGTAWGTLAPGATSTARTLTLTGTTVPSGITSTEATVGTVSITIARAS